MGLPAVGKCSPYAADTQPGCAVLQQLQFMGVDITGQDLSPIVHIDSHGKGLAARSGTHVQYPILRPRLRRQHRQSCRSVLHHEMSRLKGGQTLQIAGTGHRKTSVQPGVTLYRDVLPMQFPLQLLIADFQPIGLYRGWDDLVVALEKLLRLLPPDLIQKPLHQPLRMAVAHGEIPRRRVLRKSGHIQPVGHKFSQHRVDQTGRLGAAVALDHLHRLIHRSPVGDLVHKQDLIGPDPQNIQNDRLQMVGPLGTVTPDIVIQQHPVLDHAIGEPGGQSGVPAVQPVFGNGTLQAAVGPGVGAGYLHQNLQRRIPGCGILFLVHRVTSTGWPAR